MRTKFLLTSEMADLIFEMLHRPSHLTFIESDSAHGRDIKTILPKWVGGQKDDSRALMFSLHKASSLLVRGSTVKPCATPVPNYPDGCLHEGGFREREIITALSGWASGKVDLVFALLFYWAIRNETRLHHIGFEYPNRLEWQIAIDASLEKYCNPRLDRPAPGHKRTYVRYNANHYIHPVWIEHQLWDTDRVFGMHLDVQTDDPMKAAAFISEQSGLQMESIEPVPNSPCAFVTLYDEDDDRTKISFHFRPVWEEVEDW